MQCVKCGGDVWDNRAKKAEGKFKPNAPDFSCRDKSCGWNSGFGKATTSPVKAPSVPQDAPEPSPRPSDSATADLFWASFDNVLDGLKERKLIDLFKGEDIVKLVATQFIGRRG